MVGDNGTKGMNSGLRWWGMALGLALAIPAVASGQPGDLAVTLYAGRLSGEDWHRVLVPGTTNFADAYLASAALGKTVHRSASLPLTWEVEGQLAKHFGDQDNWEVNLLGAVRWHRFPWNDQVRTTASFGLGPSWASSLPRFEVANNGTSQQWLAYWHLELTLAPPESDWSLALRLHHRSTAYGLFGEDGGYNALTLGMRIPI